MSIDIDLTGRIALVTGGVRGVGRGICEVLSAAGATVVVCARRKGDYDGEFYECDVRNPDAVDALVAAIVADHGTLDIVVNNAGGAPHALAADASPNFHRKIIDLNLLAPLYVSKAANEVMQGQPNGGSIVMISSVSAHRPSPGTASYGAAKAGVDSLISSLAVEWAPKVRVNSVIAGLVETESSHLHYGDVDGIAAVRGTVPMGRMATPQDIGNGVLFFSSELASYVSGSTITMHGGGERPAFLAAADTTKGER